MIVKNSLIKVLNYFAILILSIIGIFVLAFNTFVTMDWHEIPLIRNNNILILLLFVVFLCIMIIMQPVLDKIPTKLFFGVVFFTFALAGLYLVLNADTKLSLSDPFFCINAANDFNHGNYASLRRGQYLAVYPFQLFWVSLLRLPLSITTSIRFLYILNYIWGLVAFILFYKIATLVGINNSSINTVTFLYVCFLPNLYNCLFIYNNVPAYTIFLLSIYFFIKSFNKRKSYLYYFIVMFTCVVAYFIKNNFLIGIIAILIIYWLSDLKLKDKLLITVFGIACILTINLSVTNYYKSKGHLDSGIPKIAYVVMGLQQSGPKYGRFSGYTVKVLKSENFSTDLANQQAKKDLTKRYVYLRKHPKYMLKFFIKKTITTWTDPLFQSIWDGPLESNGAKYNTRIISSVYSTNGKGILARISAVISQLCVLTTIIVAIYGAVNLCIKNNMDTNLKVYGNFALLFLIGGFIFHLFWETKSQYVWQYVDILLPFSGVMLTILADFLMKALGKGKNNYVEKEKI